MPPEAIIPGASRGAVERLVRRDRRIVATGLALLCALAWLWVLRGAGMGMTALEMTRGGLFPHLHAPGAMTASMPMPGASGSGGLLIAVSMWWVMMVAMMLPSAAPMLLLYAGTVRHAQRRGRMSAPPATAAFLAGYLAAWLGFSVAAAVLQQALVVTGLLSRMGLWSASPLFSAGLLGLAAAYQLTPAKRACLEHCRDPVNFLSRRWRAGPGGAVRMGLEHGAYCLGCCWGLMLLLFVGGVMNLLWIAALAGFVLVEKLGVPGLRNGVLSATLLAGWAVATLAV